MDWRRLLSLILPFGQPLYMPTVIKTDPRDAGKRWSFLRYQRQRQA
jgi:hypothetical protein